MSKSKRVLGRPLPNASLPRNPFDRSCRVNFNSFAGGIFPIYAEPFLKGSHLKINRSIFQRTADVNTAAFAMLDTHIEFFEVPLRQLWSLWYDFKLNIQDYNSTSFGVYGTQFNPNIANKAPQFDLFRVTSQMWTSYRTSTSTSIFGTSKAACSDADRLLDLLGYGFFDLTQTNVGVQTSGLKVNPFKLCAYQKIYQDHFRNTAYESNDPYKFNLDHLNTGTQNIQTVPDTQLKELLTMRYVNYRRDYFTNVYPALNYVASSPSGLSWQIPASVAGLASGAISVAIQNNLTASADNFTGSSETDTYKWFGNTAIAANSNVVTYAAMDPSNKAELSAAGVPLIHTHGINHTHTVNLGGSISGSASANNEYNVQNIRAAFALDKLLRQTSYAPKHVKDQMEARFGIKGTQNDKESIRICAFKNDIVIGEVTQTAPGVDSGGSYQPLGTIGGKGIGGDSFRKDGFEYTTKDDSIVMGVMYTLPRASYDSTFVKNWNLKEDREDFFQPEFMDLGLQPVYRGEYNLEANGQNAFGTNILGYVPRYQEYKIGIDTNHGLFNSGLMLSPFTVHTNASKMANVSHVTDGLSAAFFKVSPSDLDDIFVTAYDPLQQTHDQFINCVDISVISNQDMSVHGQPRL